MLVFLDPAKTHLESGLYFDPPHAECFRLEHCDHVKALKGHGVAEMDFAWWEAGREAIHLLEVRDYSDPAHKLAVDFLVHECVQKATDCLLMLASVWYGLPAGERLRECVPETWQRRPAERGHVFLTFVIKTTTQNDKVSIGQVQNRVRDKLKGRLELLELRGSTTVQIMDHETARQRGVPLKTEEDFAPADDGRRGKGRRR